MGRGLAEGHHPPTVAPHPLNGVGNDAATTTQVMTIAVDGATGDPWRPKLDNVDVFNASGHFQSG